MAASKTLAFEIGTEEIPAFELVKAQKQLEAAVPACFEDAHIVFEDFKVLSTPRRLIVLMQGILPETEALTTEYKGPSSAVAFDVQGNPTKAACGFARGKGLEVEELERRSLEGVEYVYAVKRSESQSVSDLLPAVLESIIEGISWSKSCRWGTQTVYFSRPVRWLLALLDHEVVPLHFAGLAADRYTRGHRVMAPGVHEVTAADTFLSVLESSFVIPDAERRETIIREGIAAIEADTGAYAEIPEKTLTEVVNLTEYPTPLLGIFDEEFLEVPEEIIVDALLMHQRYFPLYDTDHTLINRFIAVSNGNPAYADIIIDGNERVVRPRLSDAKFFYEEDLKHPLAYYVDELDKVVFQDALGTMKDKVERMVTLAGCLAEIAGLEPGDADDLCRAAYLCKADLVCNTVVEFTSVQGVMGAYYAEAAGEHAQVVRAIADHYHPCFAGDKTPESKVGKLLALTDKLDTITGLFAVKQSPTGSSDPFALRRGAIGIITMLAEGLPVSLLSALDASLDTYVSLDFDRQAVRNELITFFVMRTKVILRDRGYSADVVDAVLAGGVQEPAEIIARVEALENARRDMADVMSDLAAAYARANNIREADLGCAVDETKFNEAEQVLYHAIQSVDPEVELYIAKNQYAQALRALAALRAPIDRFFEEVLIMDKDEALRNNRLRLLNCFVETFVHVADFGKIAKSGK